MDSNRLTTPVKLPQDIAQVLAHNGPIGQVPALRDGKAADRIVEALQAASIKD